MVFETTNGIESKICFLAAMGMLESRRETIVCFLMQFCIDTAQVFPGRVFRENDKP
jgi:hypothetical protein